MGQGTIVTLGAIRLVNVKSEDAFTIACACWKEGEHEAAQSDRKRNRQRHPKMTTANGGAIVMLICGEASVGFVWKQCMSSAWELQQTRGTLGSSKCSAAIFKSGSTVSAAAGLVPACC